MELPDSQYRNYNGGCNWDSYHQVYYKYLLKHFYKTQKLNGIFFPSVHKYKLCYFSKTLLLSYLRSELRIGRRTVSLALPSFEVTVAVPSMVSKTPFTTCQLSTVTIPVSEFNVYLAPVQLPLISKRWKYFSTWYHVPEYWNNKYVCVKSSHLA